MRIVIDLQAAQSPGSRIRGIGRYSLALAEAMAEHAGDHDVWIALNHAVPDVIDNLRARFARIIPEDRVVVWESLPGTAAIDPANTPVRKIAERFRDRFLAGLAPDVVHTTSLFEGLTDEIVTSVPALMKGAIQAVSLYDLIPYVRRQVYLQDAGARAWYLEKLGHLSRARLLLAISEHTRQEAIEHLAIDPARIVNISAGLSSEFRILEKSERDAIEPLVRARYGLVGRFVIYTGGFDARKNIDGLIRAFALMPKAVRAGVQLVIVGHGPDPEIQRLIDISGQVGLDASEVVFTGYVSDEHLRALYNLCELHVFPSFHEGFGLPVLEAMACGAAVIGANATSLPEVIGLDEALFDPNSVQEMSDLIARCLSEPARRGRLRTHAALQVTRFSWEDSAKRALSAMERAHAGLNRAKSAIADAPAEAGVRIVEAASEACALLKDEHTFERIKLPLARAIALNEGAGANRQLFVDVTVLARVDIGTGIQRVVRNILRQLMANPPQGYDVRPVRFVHGLGYFHAHAFTARLAQVEPMEVDDCPIDPFPGDVLLGLDLIAHVVPGERPYFEWLRRRGVALWFVVYDLLPVLHPAYFEDVVKAAFPSWYAALGELASGLACISCAVADELRDWYDQIQPQRQAPLPIGYFHLGADLDKTTQGALSPPVRSEASVPTFLMVGTVEPRKSHALVLDAFDGLWERNLDVRLVIVGKAGWLVGDLLSRLRNHKHAGSRLIWHESASDELLNECYANASALIMASEAEGFGLPLIEAAQHGVPLIARDLPVFREVAGEGAAYFDSPDGAALASFLIHWLEQWRSNLHPHPDKVKWITWAQSAEQLLQVVLGKAATMYWQPGMQYRITAVDPRISSSNGRLEQGKMVPDGTAGYLLYGPYCRIVKGQYDVKVVVEVPSSGRTHAILDMVAFDTHETLHHVELAKCRPASGKMAVEFRLESERDLEAFQVRLYVPDEDYTAFVSCTLTPAKAEADGSAVTYKTEHKDAIDL